MGITANTCGHWRSCRVAWAALLITAPLMYGCSAGRSTSPSSTADGRAELRVDDHDATGVVGDELLSLGEAIRLVSGELALASLGEAEARQLRGNLVAGEPALIRVVVGRGEVIEVAEPLPVVKGLDGSIIDGGGSTLRSTGESGTAFLIASSDFTLQDFSFDNFGTAALINPQGVRDLHDILLTRLDVVTNGIGIGMTARTSSGSLGSLRRVTISESRFEGVPGPYGIAQNGIRVEGMTASGTEPDDPVIDGVLIVGNHFGSGLLEGVDIAGFTGIAAAGAPPPSDAGAVRNVTIRDNVFADCPDACILGISALSIGGVLTNIGVSGIRILDNDMATNGSGVYLVGGYSLGAGSTADNFMRHIEIRGNRIHPGPSGRCGGNGVALVADAVDVSNGTGERDRMGEAVIEGNDISGCFRGVLLAAVATPGTAASLLTDNHVSDVRIVGNRLAGNAAGIHVSGAYIIDGRLLGNSPVSGSPGAAVLRENTVQSIGVEANEITDSTQALLVTGGSVIGANGNTVTGNRVRGLDARDNRSRGNGDDCVLVADYSSNSNSLVVGNFLDDVNCP
jgi:hypothetical protein